VILRLRRIFLAAFSGALLPLTVVATAQQEKAEAWLSEPGPTFVVPAKDIPAKWTVIAYGDTRFTNPANTEVTNPKVRRWLVDKIASEHPDALLVSGDLPYNGSVSADYDVFRKETEIWRTEKLRVFPTLGNHELSHDPALGLKNWWATFPELKGRRWYSVQFGNAYFIALDSDVPLTAESEQRKWLADQLAHLPKETQFVLVELHHPPVADNVPALEIHFVRPNEDALAAFLKERAPHLKARIVVIAGHVHNYARFEQGGVTYLVSGGGGAKPHPVFREEKDLYKDPPQVNYHYVKFVFDGESMNATMYRVDSEAAEPVWEAKDSFRVATAK
jgi:3',5'-cyclic AMP phosphodiesterase CpdA